MSDDLMPDSYEKGTIKAGDKGSKAFSNAYAQTLKQEGIAEHIVSVSAAGTSHNFVRIPEGSIGVAFSCKADERLPSPYSHARSLGLALQSAALTLGVKPIAMTNVVDASSADPSVRKMVEMGLLDLATEKRNGNQLFGIINGEYAILPGRINPEFHVSMNGMMVGHMSLDEALARIPRDALRTLEAERVALFTTPSQQYILFHPDGKLVGLNSDGVGSKTAVNSRFAHSNGAHSSNRRRILGQTLYDSGAMKADDVLKWGAKLVALVDYADCVNCQGYTLQEILSPTEFELSDLLDAIYQVHALESQRVLSWAEGVADFNVSGSAVSLVDPDVIARLGPQEGQSLIALRSRGPGNSRSNGFTEYNEELISKLGNNWHLEPLGIELGAYLMRPSTIFYNAVGELIGDGDAEFFTHLSGGSYKGKLAAPLARVGLHVDIHVGDLFPMAPEALMLGGFRHNTLEQAMAKWPLGAEAFIATSKPDEVLYLNNTDCGGSLEAKVVGTIRREPSKTGVTIHSGPGVSFNYSGKD